MSCFYVFVLKDIDKKAKQVSSTKQLKAKCTERALEGAAPPPQNEACRIFWPQTQKSYKYSAGFGTYKYKAGVFASDPAGAGQQVGEAATYATAHE